VCGAAGAPALVNYRSSTPFDAIGDLRYTVGYFHGPQISDKDLKQDLERISTRVRTMIAAHIEETIQCAG
jgi:hypothetical protein